MFSNRSIDIHQFAMIPRADIPRSTFRIESMHKTTIDAGYLYPLFLDEVLPGDLIKLKATMFCRLATPIFPVMDNLHLDTFFFFVPARLVWDNWVKMNGEQKNPADTISYTVPQIVSPAGGYAVGSIYDYFGLPTVGQVGAGNTITHSALPLRCYALCWDEWFRDQNIQNSINPSTGDGPDLYTAYTLKKRGKRHDYFTSCLPWPLKGGVNVSLPLGTTAPVKTAATRQVTGSQTAMTVALTSTGAALTGAAPWGNDATSVWQTGSGAFTPSGNAIYPSNLYADLTTATAATINQLRQAIQIQKLLERDARGGTRYTEMIRAHWNVINPDFRLQRPEYLGGGSTPIVFNPIAQTSGSGATGTTSPLGNLAAMATGLARNHGFVQSFTEHGYIIGLVNIRADLNYQQGMRKLWSRQTRYDFYMPEFQALGEQAVLNKEIYCDGSANDNLVFGYQERWAEYRYQPSMVTGLFRSTSAGTIDNWHLAQKFTTLPTLNTTFIEETPPVDRVLAVGAAANGKQFIFDSMFEKIATRAMPTYSVPGLMDHF